MTFNQIIVLTDKINILCGEFNLVKYCYIILIIKIELAMASRKEHKTKIIINTQRLDKNITNRRSHEKNLTPKQ